MYYVYTVEPRCFKVSILYVDFFFRSCRSIRALPATAYHDPITQMYETYDTLDKVYYFQLTKYKLIEK